ncbi:MAG TPA: GNAT family N-acetyltransferase [Candidatus Limnocylindrales bacterium]|nr:GNAT family N-acetyltransferase [Candidatus Limnocylindrales bacterium]
MTSRTSLPPPDAPAGSGATFRRWRGIEDVDGMAAANARLRDHVGLLEPVDVASMVHRYTHLVNSDPVVDCILVEREGETRGYARVEWHDLTDGDRIYDSTVVLEPSAWGLGLAEAMLAWAEARSMELAREHPTERRSHLSGGLLEGDDSLEAARAAAGYEAVRWDAEMLRPDMEDLPEVAIPDGYTLRPPEPEELPAVHAMMITAFADHWGEYVGSDFPLEEWIEDPRFRRELVVVAWKGAEPASAVCNIVEQRPDGTIRGLLDTVCTHPAHRRQGLARAAIARSLSLLRAEGAGSAYLGVDTDNHHRALALYESCGFRRVSTSVLYRKPMPATKDRP